MNQNKSRLISIIIPVLNEEETIANLLSYLHDNTSLINIKEIIVVDGGSTDNTVNLAQDHDVQIIHSKRGRS